MKQEISGFGVLAGAVEQALRELDAQNYGNARRILQDALKNTKEVYLVNKQSAYDVFR